VFDSNRLTLDRVLTNPNFYKAAFENEGPPVLEYFDQPGQQTTPHGHADSVMYSLSSFQQRLPTGEGATHDVETPAGTTGWLATQPHADFKAGETNTRVIFVECKGSSASLTAAGALGLDF